MSQLTDFASKPKGKTNSLKDKRLPGYIIHLLAQNIKGKSWEDEADLSLKWIQRYRLGDETEELVKQILEKLFSLKVVTSERLSLCDVEGVDIILPKLGLVFQVKSSVSGIRTFNGKDYLLKEYITPIYVDPRDRTSKRALYFYLKKIFEEVEVTPNKLALRIEKLSSKKLYRPKLIQLAQLIGFHDSKGDPYNPTKSLKKAHSKPSKQPITQSSKVSLSKVRKVRKLITTSAGPVLIPK